MGDNIKVRYDQKRITPFWHKLPFFFGFPLRFGPLAFLACIVAASALAGILLGTFGLVFKGFLAYLGLRYAFNVLELFSKGRFEGESPDHRLWGPEKRPAKLGTVIALFIVVAANLGNMALERRLARDTGLQEQLIARYKVDHAEELAQLARDREAFQRRAGLADPAGSTSAPADPDHDDEDGQASPSAASSQPPTATSVPATPPPPELAMPREDIIAMYRPSFGDALWFAWQPMWFWLVVSLLSLMLPSAAVTIALEDSLPRALNPLNVVHLIQAMGAAYFVLWGFFLAIAGSRQLAFTLGANWPAAVRFPVEMALASYLGLVLFAIMGYALYQFHQELHLDVDVDFDEHREAGGAEAIASAGSARSAAIKAGAAVDPWERKLQDLVAAGKVAEAIAEVKDRMRYDRGDLPLNARLHTLYLKQGERTATLAHGQQYLSALARAGDGRTLVQVLRKLQLLEPAFLPEDGNVVLPGALAAVQQRDFALATTLLRGFDKRFPRHADTPGVIFLGAKLLSEQSRQHDKAAKLLRAVLHHYPDHAVAAEARAYLLVLERMLSRPPVPA